MNHTTMFDAVQLALSIVAIDAAVTIQTENQAALLTAFKGVDYAVYVERQSAVSAELVTSGKSINAAAAAKMFTRVMDAIGVTKPKSVSVDAVQKAANREVAALTSAAATEVAVKKYAGKKGAAGDAHALAAGYTKALKKGDATMAALLLKATKAATDAQLKGETAGLKERLAAVLVKIRAACKSDVKALAKAERMFK